MMLLVTILLLLAVLLILPTFLKKTQGGKGLTKFSLLILLAIVVGFALAPRLGWFVPLLNLLLLGAVKYAPQLLGLAMNAWAQSKTHSNSQAPASNASTMSIPEAYQILGLTPGASQQEIISAHRRLMQKIHPDRGGSDYLATKINQARETLLAH